MAGQWGSGAVVVARRWRRLLVAGVGRDLPALFSRSWLCPLLYAAMWRQLRPRDAAGPGRLADAVRSFAERVGVLQNDGHPLRRRRIRTQ